MDLSELPKRPRADTISAENDHNRHALHAFAFEQANGWLPIRLRQYHPGRENGDELMEGYYDEFIPITYDSGRGRVLKKKVEEKTIYCDECHVPARKDDRGESICPECGLVCIDATNSDNLVRDAKAAHRVTK